MSLNFGFEKIADKSVLFVDGKVPEKGEDGDLNVETHNCIVGCYNTGMNSITEKNVDEWWRRYELTMKYNNTPEQFWGLSKDDVIARIGLTTNVTQVSATKFNKVYAPKK